MLAANLPSGRIVYRRHAEVVELMNYTREMGRRLGVELTDSVVESAASTALGIPPDEWSKTTPQI